MGVVNVTSSNWSSGAGVVDSYNSLITDIKNAHDGDKGVVAVEIGVAAVGAVIDTVAFALNPLSKLIAAGLGWLIEHVSFLKKPLDLLAGNPDGIKTLADDLHKIGQDLRNAASDMDKNLQSTLQNWTGQAGDAYKKNLSDRKGDIDGAGHSVDIAGYVVETTMALISAVRSLIRDMITSTLGDIISTMLIALATAPITFGASIAVGVSKCVVEGIATVAEMMSKLAKLIPFASRVAQRLDELVQVLRRTGTSLGNKYNDIRGIRPPDDTNTGTPLHDLPPNNGGTHNTGNTDPAAGGGGGHTNTNGNPNTGNPTPHDPNANTGNPTPHDPNANTGNPTPHDPNANTGTNAGDTTGNPHTNDPNTTTTSSAADPNTGTTGRPNPNGQSSNTGDTTTNTPHDPNTSSNAGDTTANPHTNDPNTTTTPSSNSEPSTSTGNGGRPNNSGNSSNARPNDTGGSGSGSHNNPNTSGDNASTHSADDSVFGDWLNADKHFNPEPGSTPHTGGEPSTGGANPHTSDPSGSNTHNDPNTSTNAGDTHTNNDPNASGSGNTNAGDTTANPHTNDTGNNPPHDTTTPQHDPNANQPHNDNANTGHNDNTNQPHNNNDNTNPQHNQQQPHDNAGNQGDHHGNNDHAGGNTPPKKDPESLLKPFEHPNLKKHEDWLKNTGFGDELKKTKIVEEYLKKNHPDVFTALKTISDLKSSKNMVGLTDKYVLNLVKQLADIQQKAQMSWDQANTQWQKDHPGGSGG